MFTYCVFFDAFKVTFIKALEAETHVASLFLHFNCSKAQAHMRMTGQLRIIAKQCKKIKKKLTNHVGHACIPATTPGAQKTD